MGIVEKDGSVDLCPETVRLLVGFGGVEGEDLFRAVSRPFADPFLKVL